MISTGSVSIYHLNNSEFELVLSSIRPSNIDFYFVLSLLLFFNAGGIIIGSGRIQV